MKFKFLTIITLHIIFQLAVPHNTSAQASKYIKRYAKKIVKSYIKEEFKEAINNYSYRISVRIHNDTRYTQRVHLSWDGNNWYYYDIYPDYYQDFNSNNNGVLGLFSPNSGYHYIIKQQGLYYISGF